MAGGADNGDDSGLITTINVTPLVDIVLVLLIVLMVTSAYIVSRSINVELPKAATGEPTDASLSISIDAEDNLYLNGQKVGQGDLQEGIREARSRNREIKAIISADGRVRHARVVFVIDMLRREKVNKFAINTSPLELEEQRQK